jgi:hypothetical protein
MGVEPKSETPNLVDSGDGPSILADGSAPLSLARPSIQTCDHRAKPKLQIGNHLRAR